MEWESMPEGNEKYHAYLCSREWAEKKNEVTARCGGICERCNHFEVERVHHLTYIRKYKELPEDLRGLCLTCHDYTHGKSDVDLAATVQVADDEELIALAEVAFGVRPKPQAKVIKCPKCQYNFYEEENG